MLGARHRPAPVSEQPRNLPATRRRLRSGKQRLCRPETSRRPAPTGERRAFSSVLLRSSEDGNNNQELRRATNSGEGKAISGDLFVAGDQPDLAEKLPRPKTRFYIRLSIFLVDLVSDGGIESCLRLRPRKRESRGKRVTGSHNLRVGSWNIVRGILNTEKIVISGDFNGHIGATSNGFDDAHEGFGFGERNGGGTSLLDFAKAFELVIANSCFSKENHRYLRSFGHKGDRGGTGSPRQSGSRRPLLHRKWVECVDEEVKRELKKVYKTTKTVKLVVTKATQLSMLQMTKWGQRDKKLYRLEKQKRKARDWTK
ncbi:hypothetical protein H5410_023621 [Solanum commersonii]|uniref:Craniofacial development protein 2-like n=1 Tax=Solanum commersonii TaxID=4109 RepID=A0A9J5ZJS8_SOLCO|nr:hypothetical protein H5410_023621 [Solanum commersonii]